MPTPHADADGTRPVRILIVEDDPLDAELVVDRLRDDGLAFEARVVADEAAFRAALDTFRPGLVLSDLSLPGFSGHRALQVLREVAPLTPFIFVSGTIGETAAVEALQAGATDYILKNNPARLASAARRALAEADDRQLRAQAELQLVRGQRFESLAILAGSLSHDLRNILQPVLMAAQMIEGQATQPELRKYGTLIRDCSERGLEMISAILDFARGSRHTGRGHERVKVATLLEAVGLLLRPSLPRNVDLQIAAVDPHLYLPGNATEFQQCLLNLCLNGVQAMPDGGRLLLEADLHEPTPAFFRADEAAHAGSYVRIRVCDSGHGMGADTIAKLFSPFFTTKSDGTGLGLVSCRRIVANHGGVMRVQSTPDTGTRFEIHLPQSVPQADGTPSDTFDSSFQGSDERIMVITEEAATLSLIGDALALYGYMPILAQSSATAMQALERGPPPAALVLDSELKLMSAETTLKTVRERGLLAPVLVLGEGAMPLDGRRKTVRIHKPVTIPGLLRALRDTLHRVPRTKK